MSWQGSYLPVAYHFNKCHIRDHQRQFKRCMTFADCRPQTAMTRKNLKAVTSSSTIFSAQNNISLVPKILIFSSSSGSPQWCQIPCWMRSLLLFGICYVPTKMFYNIFTLFERSQISATSLSCFKPNCNKRILVHSLLVS